MGLFDRFRKEKKTSVNPDGLMINNTYRYTLNDYTRLAIETIGTQGITGLDEKLLTEKLLYFYDNMLIVSDRIKILMETFSIDEETAKRVEYVSFAKTSLIGDYYLYKERGATKFYIRDKNKKLKSNLNINDFIKYVGFMINNDGVPVFNIKKIPKKRYTDVLKQKKTEQTNIKPVETAPEVETKEANQGIGFKLGMYIPHKIEKDPKDLTELDKLKNREIELHYKMENEKGYYGSDISKEEFRELNKLE